MKLIARKIRSRDVNFNSSQLYQIWQAISVAQTLAGLEQVRAHGSTLQAKNLGPAEIELLGAAGIGEVCAVANSKFPMANAEK